MTPRQHLRKLTIKKGASHPSSIRKPRPSSQKLVDKQEQAEITMKSEETEKLKLQYYNNIQTTISQVNNIQDSDIEIAEKNYPHFKRKRSFKKCATSVVDIDIALLKADKNNKITKKDHKSTENQINLSTNT